MQHMFVVTASAVRQQGKRLLELEADHLVGRGRDLVGDRGEIGPERIALPPALDRGNAVLRQHRRVVVEFQSVAQRDVPLQLVAAHRVAGCHLRMRLELVVEPVQGVEHQERVVAGDVGRGPDRIERGQIGLRNEFQYLLGIGARDARSGQGNCECSCAGQGRLQDVTAFHVNQTSMARM